MPTSRVHWRSPAFEDAVGSASGSITKQDILSTTAIKPLPRSFHNTDIGVSAFSSPTAVAAAYKQIKREIEELEVAIRAPWERASQHAKLHCTTLPRYSPLFSNAVHDTAFHSKLDWIKVTHVCTHWRRTALECPSLLTNIPFSRFRWANEMLKRSKTASLTIVANINARDSRHMGLVQSAMAEMFRIQAISLSQTASRNEEPLEQILKELTKPASLLEDFSVSFNDRTSLHILPKDSFGGEVPRLQQVELQSCALAWGCFYQAH